MVPSCQNRLPVCAGFGGYYGGDAAGVLQANRKRGVLVQAWSPLRRALSGKAKARCTEIGARYGKSAAQVGLRPQTDSRASHRGSPGDQRARSSPITFSWRMCTRVPYQTLHYLRWLDAGRRLSASPQNSPSWSCWSLREACTCTCILAAVP